VSGVGELNMGLEHCIMVLKGRNGGTMGEASSGATVVSTTLIYSGLGQNLDVCGKNPTTDRSRLGMGLHARDKREFIRF
jgi:hypothetical protein